MLQVLDRPGLILVGFGVCSGGFLHYYCTNAYSKTVLMCNSTNAGYFTTVLLYYRATDYFIGHVLLLYSSN